MLCIPFFHDYKIIDAQSYYVQQVEDYHKVEAERTRILFICHKCGAVEVKVVEGKFEESIKERLEGQ